MGLPPSSHSRNILTSGPLALFLPTNPGLPGLRPRLSSALWTALAFTEMLSTVSWAFWPPPSLEWQANT